MQLKHENHSIDRHVDDFNKISHAPDCKDVYDLTESFNSFNFAIGFSFIFVMFFDFKRGGPSDNVHR